MSRPFFLVYLLPLIVGVAFLVTFATGFVPLYPGQGPLGPAYGFPFAWKVLFCEIIPCGVLVNWSVFGLDMLFYAAVQYGLIVFYGIRTERLPRPPSLQQLLSRNMLGVTFQLALVGGMLMVIVPFWAFPLQPGAPGYACLVPSPCQTQLDNWDRAYTLMMNLWVFSGLVTIFAAVMLGVLGYLARPLLGGILIGLSAVHLSGLVVFLTSGVAVLLNIGQVQVSLIAVALSAGPLLVLAAGIRFNAKTSHDVPERD